MKDEEEFGNSTSRGPAAATEQGPSAAQVIAQRFESVPPLPAHTRWATVIAAGGLLDSFTTMIVAAALPALIPALHIGYAKVGLVISAAFFGMFAGAIVFGALSERYGRRTILGVTIMLFGITSVFCAFSWNFTSLFWLRVLQGLGLGGLVPVAATFSAECMPAKVRGKAFGLSFGLLFALGFILAPLTGVALTALLSPAASWRVMFLVGGLAFPFGIATFWLLPESPRWLSLHGRLPQAEAVLAKLESTARKLHRPLLAVATPRVLQHKATRFSEAFGREYRGRTILIGVAFFTTYFVQYGLSAWLPTLYVKIGGLSPSKALTLAMISGCVQVASAILIALTVDRFGRVSFLKLGFWLAIAGVVLGSLALTVFHISAWPVLFVSTIPLYVGISFNSGLVYIYAPELFPTRMRTLITASGSAAGRIGSIVAPIIIGGLLQAKLGLLSVFIALGIAGVLGLVIASIFGVETKQKSLEDIAH